MNPGLKIEGTFKYEMVLILYGMILFNIIADVRCLKIRGISLLVYVPL